MKKIKVLLLMTLFILGSTSLAQAFSTVYISPDRAFSLVGQKGLVMEVVGSSVEPIAQGSGIQSMQCKLKGIVLKGNDEYPASDAVQEVTFKVVKVKGLMPCAAGMKGIYSIYGKSRLGNASFVGQQAAQIPFVADSDGVLRSAQRRLKINDTGLKAKFMKSNPNLTVSLGMDDQAAQNQAPTAEDVRTYVKFLVQEYWPDYIQKTNQP